jgi:hypothetical protein
MSATECGWFAGCGRPATGTTPHPILGEVPTCDRCAAFAGHPRVTGPWYTVVEFNTEADGTRVSETARTLPRCVYGPFADEAAAVRWMEEDYPDDDTDVHDMWAVSPDDAAAMDLTVVNAPDTVVIR